MVRGKTKSVLTVTNIEWQNTEDDYDKGEIGKSFGVLYEANVGRYDSPEEMMRELIHKFGLPEDRDSWMAFDDGRIDVQFLVNEDNTIADKYDVEEWKKKELKLWSAYVIIYFVESIEREPSTSEIARMFKISES